MVNMNKPKQLTAEDLSNMSSDERSKELRSRMVEPSRLPEGIRDRLVNSALKKADNPEVEAVS